MTDNKNDKYNCNDIIKYYPNIDNIFILSSGTNMDPLLVVTSIIIGGKKHGEAVITGITCLWYSRYTHIMINRQHNKYYDPRMRSNKVEYSKATGSYFITHDVNVPFGIPYFLEAI